MSATAAIPYDLLGPDWDSPGRFATSYLILSTPRSGSTLLAESMAGTGRLGVPAEYLEFDVAAPYLARRWGTRGLLEYRDRLLELRTSPNGVFGAKIHWHQLARVVNGLYEEPSPEDAVAVLDRIFPRARLIRIKRRDTILQAVSHWRALNTGQFATVQRARAPEPEYDFDALQSLLAFILHSERGWDAFLQHHPDDVLVLDYEDVAADLSASTRRCAAHVGIEESELDILRPRLEKQRDEWTAGIRERFEADLRRAAS